ncbi:MAG: hypothetical protein J0M29_01165 [Chitinophagales bacterium]|nr:hypothetical protein [Chitinophagales bacterium]
MKFQSVGFFFLFASLSVHNCTESPKQAATEATPALQKPVAQADPGFATYWYAGTAELATYDVIQDRYGETRKAEQVSVFVTEDFSANKHVKLDDPMAAGADRVPVLKLNWIRRFHTGIYDYSLMQSIFSPIDGSLALKTTTSIQDWCGQVFQQFDHQQDGYKLQSHSYFESEGDQQTFLPDAILEDALWTMVRLNPASIPAGVQRLVPSAIYHRFQHIKETVQSANLQIIRQGDASVLQVQYSGIPRSLAIRFETNFPHKILGWEETYAGKKISEGKLKSVRKEAYWQKNHNENEPLRDSLNLRF